MGKEIPMALKHMKSCLPLIIVNFIAVDRLKSKHFYQSNWPKSKNVLRGLRQTHTLLVRVQMIIILSNANVALSLESINAYFLT